MDNKSNIYKSKPEFVKEGFDPFSVQILKGGPLPTPSVNMFWRTPENWLFRYAVDSEGRLILGEWEGDTTPYVIRLEIETGFIFTQQRSLEDVPELNTWGNSPKTATLGGNNETTIDYDGQYYEISPDGMTITPELSNYQEEEAPPPPQTIFMRQYSDGIFYGVDKQGGLVVDNPSPFSAKCLQRNGNGVYSIGTSSMTSAIAEDWGITEGTFTENSIEFEKDGVTQTYVVENGNCTPTPSDFS